MIRANSSAVSTVLRNCFGVLGGFFISDDSDAKPLPKEPPAERPKPIVLVIDDDEKYLETVRDLLAGTAFRVLTSSSGAKGLEIVRNCQDGLRLVLLDYSMPRLDGAETLRYVRKLNPHLKVIGLTDVDVESLPASFREGVQKVVTKPVSGADLIAIISQFASDRSIQPT